MANDIVAAFEARRSVYALSKASPVSDAEIRRLLEGAVKHVPSAFNSQSARVVLLGPAAHDAFWDNAKAVLRPFAADGAAAAATDAKMESFKAGYGTVLFFEDQAVVKGLQERFAPYADNFPLWSLQSSGMLQFAVWTAFASVGLGASLQHYQPLVDAWVRERTGAPESWKLLAQMPFGTPAAPAGPKEFGPLESRLLYVS